MAAFRTQLSNREPAVSLVGRRDSSPVEGSLLLAVGSVCHRHPAMTAVCLQGRDVEHEIGAGQTLTPRLLRHAAVLAERVTHATRLPTEGGVTRLTTEGGVTHVACLTTKGGVTQVTRLPMEGDVTHA